MENITLNLTPQEADFLMSMLKQITINALDQKGMEVCHMVQTIVPKLAEGMNAAPVQNLPAQ